jgi:hypothetical protein
MTNKNKDLEARLRAADSAQNFNLEFATDPIEQAKQKAAGRVSIGASFALKSAAFKRSFLAGGVATAAATAAILGLVVGTQPAALISLGGDTRGPISESSSKVAGMDSMALAPYSQDEYTAGGDLSAAAGSGHIYEIRPLADPKTALSNLGSVLGLDGAVKSYPEDKASLYIGSSDYSAANISLYTTNGTWFYNDSSAAPSVICKGDAACEQEAEVSENYPSEQAAKQTAAALFSAAGPTFKASDIKVESTDWQLYATAILKVEGQETAIEWQASWARSGKLESATGHAVEVVDRGSFETVSAVTAVEQRLREYRWSGQMASSSYHFNHSLDSRSFDEVIEPYENPIPGANSDPVPAETSDGADSDPVPAETSDGEAVSGMVATAAPPVSMQSGGSEASETRQDKIVITSAKAALVLVHDANGRSWLVPGYEVTDGHGFYAGVISVVDGVIELPEAAEMIPMDGMAVK